DTITRAKATWEQAWKNYGAAREARDVFQAGAQRAAQQRLAYRALLDKVEAVNPQPGEEEALRARARILENAVEMYGAYSAAAEALSGNDTEAGAISALGVALAQLEHVLELSGSDMPNAQLEELRERLESAEADITDIHADIAELARGTQAQPDELSTIYSRRSELAGLRKNLGMSGEEILRAAAEARAGLEQLDDPAATLERLEKELSQAHAAMEKAGAALREARTAAGSELSRAVEAELPELSLPDAHFTVQVEAAEPGANGADSVTFLLAAHRGAPLAPLASGASGGELSRVMLALEVGLAARRAQQGHTFLFDEVDAGIGGRAASAVGKRLAKLAGSAQVIVVTHLAQVAACAEHQLVVVKQLEESTARTELRDVSGPEREAELARMLSGSDTDVARAHAAELLKAANVAL
ncbi:DNA repair protein RecN, partial [Actinotignum timonense]